MTDVLLVIPPFAMTNYPSLAAHILQAEGRKAGFAVSLFYANLIFAEWAGDKYESLCGGTPGLPGESVFAPAAWGIEKPGINTDRGRPFILYPPAEPVSREERHHLSETASRWVESMKKEMAAWDYPLVGFTSSYEQTNACFALMKALKSVRPDILTFMGGFNAEGIMAEGLASLDPERKILDFIFSGEAEISFPEFLTNWKSGRLPEERIIRGTAPDDLNNLQPVDYTDFFKQIGKSGTGTPAFVAMETSRGCWWGEKSQCIFCGYSDERLRYREKSRSRIAEELQRAEPYPSRYAHMADLIMPPSRFEMTNSDERDGADPWIFYYEQRAVWDREQLEAIKKAGIRDNQPGIETLSTELLSFMGKGTSGKSNITFLREATGTGIRLYWNFIWGFPGEKKAEYERMIELIPKIIHLIPPMGIFPLALPRFSPLFRTPERWGIGNLRPLEAYEQVFPGYGVIDSLAYYFNGDYAAETFADPSVIEEFIGSVGRWNERWKSPLTRPRLTALDGGPQGFFIIDTRHPDKPMKRKSGSVELRGLMQNSRYEAFPWQRDALAEGLAIELNGTFIPLLTMESQLREELYEKRKPER
ncbi:MAG: RiPP maturation radical SAM C-methyltransferase [Spirochaetales bacterium]|nr:RiPP maturation radical SAM C-methyltransferase [Spirochaetales bacterium]